MKLRQKLAVVLASAMVLTAVPVVTMAASTNGVNKVVTVTKDADNATTTSVLKIETKDVTGTESFVIKLENAKFPSDSGDYKAMVTNAGLASQLGSGIVSITIISNTEAIVKVTGNGANVGNIPLFVKMTGGDASVEVVPENSSLTAGKYMFAKTPVADKVGAVTADSEAFYEGTNTIGAITFTDTTPGSITKASNDDRKVTLTIDHSDYEFAESAPQITVTAGRGYTAQTVTVTGTRVTNDAQTVTFTLPSDLAVGTINGTLKVTGLKVKATTKTPEVGDLNVKVTAGVVADTTVKVADVQDYTVKLSGDKVEYVAGAAEKEVKFKLTETLADTISRGKEIEFSINHGKVTSISDATDFVTDLINDDDDNKFTIVVNKATTAKVDQEFTIKFTSDVDYEGDITLTATGKRAIGDDLTHVIATATRDFDYTTEAAVVKVGLKGQEVGKVVLTETAKGAFERGKVITLSVPAGEGVKLAGKPDVTVTGDDKFKYTVKDPVTSAGVISVDIVVDRASTAPITMTIENLPVDADRTVPEGTAKLEIKGTAIAENGKISLDDFFVVGTPNTEDLAANGLPKGTATFAIGSVEYTSNGVAATMNGGAAYIQDPGYTMVPVRYVANAFGVADKDILASSGVATIFAGTRTIQLTVGSDVAIVNGAPVKLATKVVEKEGRTYVPAGEIARILGISSSWDATAKVATFENK